MGAPLDLVVIGAGPAGLAAAMAAQAQGLRVQVIEARGRIGGRALTQGFAGHAVDVGAHWLHAGPINPVVALARARGIRLRRAPLESHLFRNGRPLPAGERQAYGAAFARADRSLSAAPQAGDADDRASARLACLGPWRRPVAAITGLVCGQPLGSISASDFASAEYADNLFAPGGLGALIARLGRGLPVRLGVAASAIDWSGRGVTVTTAAGRIEARACIVTVPPGVLQRGTIRFTPELPHLTEAAVHGFQPAIYEHVLLRWPGAPWLGADRIATLTGLRIDGVGLLTALDGSALHYLELDAPMALGLGEPRRLKAAQLAREVLRRQFGARAIHGLAVLHVTNWLGDPLSCGSWSTVPPGQARIRDDLAAPIAGRLAFAGEMTDHAQWGTVGAAWGAGARAVAALFPAG